MMSFDTASNTLQIMFDGWVYRQKHVQTADMNNVIYIGKVVFFKNAKS